MIIGEELEIISLYYDLENNYIFDVDGEIVFNIYAYITPNMLYLFKQKKEYMVVKNKYGMIVELHWPEPHDTIERRYHETIRNS